MSTDAPGASPRQGWQGLFAALASPTAFGATVFWWWAALLALRGFALDTLWGEVSLTVALRSVAAMIGVAAVIFTIGHIGLDRARSRKRGTRWLGIAGAGTYAFAALAISAIQITLDSRLNATIAMLLQRSTVAFTALLIICYCVDRRAYHLDAVARLIGQRRRLTAQRRCYDESLAALRAGLTELVSRTAGQGMLLPVDAGRRLLATPATASEIKDLADATRDCATGVIRELSHLLDQEPGVPAQRLAEVDELEDQADLTLIRRGRLATFAQVLLQVFQRNPFPPAPFGIFSFLAVFFVSLQVRSVGVAVVAGLCASVPTLATAWLANRWFSPWLVRRSFPLRLLGVIAVLATAATLGAIAVSTVISSEQPGRIGLQLAVGLVLFGLACSLILTFDHERHRVLQALGATLEGIQWESTRLQSDELGVRREIAAVLHSDIQGRLAAIAAQLEQQSVRIQQGQETAESVRPVLDACVSELERTHRHMLSLTEASTVGTTDLRQELESIESLWRPVLTLEIECDEAVFERLATSRSASTAVAVAAREGLSNALRHGGASRVWLKIETDSDSVQLTVRDDGSGVLEELVPGLGMRSMMRSGAQVSIRPGETAGCELRVRVPAPS